MSNIIEIIDWWGRKVVFTEKKWQQKCEDHPELKSRTFLRNIKRTIEEPQQVWEDKSDKTCKRCYYRKYSIDTYVKVIIWIKDDPCRVVSAFETNLVKEINYLDLKRLL